MSEVKIVRQANPSLVVSSTDPFRILGQQTKAKGPPRVSTYNNASAGVRMIGTPAQHDMRAAGPASNGKAAPTTPKPLADAGVTRRPRTIAQAGNDAARAERDRLAKEKADLERQIAEGKGDGSDGEHLLELK